MAAPQENNEKEEDEVGPGQAGLGVVQKKSACIQLETLESEIQAGGPQHVKDLCLKFMGTPPPTFSISMVAEIRK